MPFVCQDARGSEEIFNLAQPTITRGSEEIFNLAQSDNNQLYGCWYAKKNQPSISDLKIVYFCDC